MLEKKEDQDASLTGWMCETRYWKLLSRMPGMF